ncbi:MAG: CDP-diacylglycerol--glycerol-3-phosphate 3-phosphatidyltransferase, partial [Planctomycetes bacterium]|nr:CDP-diacylglycerol--glycerol-3-phosphate 3-phosphatidyltransferase [Planctomycetota bacterium]
MNLPNLITLARLALTAVVFGCLEAVPAPDSPPPSLAWAAFVVFLVAAFSDFVDGWLARRWGMVTAFGRVADPFVDKVLTSGS